MVVSAFGDGNTQFSEYQGDHTLGDLPGAVSGPRLFARPPATEDERSDRIVYLLDLLELPQPTGWCVKGARLLLKGRQDPRRRLATALPCRRWLCRVCAPRMRRSAGLHFGGRLLDCGQPLYAGRLDGGRWSADQKALRRAGAEWARVLSPDGRPLLIGTAPLGDHDGVAAEEAVRTLGAALRAVRRPPDCSRFRPVSCSASWKPPPREPPAWTRVGRMQTACTDAVLACLERHGVDGRLRQPCRGTWVVSWQIPPEWDEERRRRLDADLSKCPR